MREAAEIAKEVGFKYVDFPATAYMKEDNWEELFERDAEMLNNMGLVVEQTHAPYEFNGVPDDEYKLWMDRAFKGSKILNAKYVVIHGDKYVADENGFNFDKGLNTVYDFYAPYVEYAKKAGLGVAIENLAEGPVNERWRFTSTVEEILALVDKFNDKCISVCQDFGHGRCAFRKNHLEELKKVGDLVSCTHVHDNIYGLDLHQNLFFGDIEWEEAVKCLKETGYTGKFIFEMVYGRFPEPLFKKYLKLFYETGEYLLNL